MQSCVVQLPLGQSVLLHFPAQQTTIAVLSNTIQADGNVRHDVLQAMAAALHAGDELVSQLEDEFDV